MMGGIAGNALRIAISRFTNQTDGVLMTIEVSCPNGHRLRVAAEHAGKSGQCPDCRARVRVPKPRVTDTAIMGILGPPPKYEDSRHAPASAGGDAIQALRGQAPAAQAARADANPSDSSVVRRQKFCVNCGRMSSFTFKWCPGCGQLLHQHPAIGEGAASE